MIEFLTAKPVLIGLHLGFAILGIDAFLWVLGKFRDSSSSVKSRMVPALIGTGAFLLSWLVGGYYYVVYYGSLVKPVIKAGIAPWAHAIAMETKEHIFLFILPLAITATFIAMLGNKELDRLKIRGYALLLCGVIAGLGFLIGAMGFVISAAARWGVIN